jgi:hypothetical protein
MPLTIPPNVIQRLIIRGKHESVTKNFSGTHPFDPEKAAKVAKALRHDIQITYRSAVIASPDTVCQFLFVNEGNIHCITRPMVATDATNDTIYLASMSDTIGKSVPVQIHATEFRAYFTTLISTADVTTLGLQHANELPDTIPGPVIDQGEEAAAPGLIRLNWDRPPEHAPMISSLPKFIMVPIGVLIPSGPWPVTQEKPEVTAAFPPIETWRKAQHYNYQNNDSFSVTKGGPLMDISQIAADQFRDTIAEKASAEFLMVSATSQQYNNVESVINEYSDSAWAHLGSLLPDEAPTPAVGTPTPPQQGLGTEHIKQIVETIAQSSRSTRDKENSKTATDMNYRYQLLFARLSPSQESGDCQPTVVPGDLNPEFEKIIKNATLSNALRELQELLRTANGKAASSHNRLDAEAAFGAEMIDGVFAAGLRNFNWMQESINTAPERVNQTINLACFAHPERNSLCFRQRIVNGHTVSSQEAVGEERSKMEKKTTELYTGGRLSTGRDITKAICNLRLLCKTICNNFEDSELWKAMARYEGILHSVQGKEWIDRAVGRENPQVALNLLVDLQDILTGFVRIANVPEYRQALASKENISPADYQKANVTGESLITNLSAAVQRSNYAAYEHMPPVAEAFPHLKLPSRTAGQTLGSSDRGPAPKNSPQGAKKNESGKTGDRYDAPRTAGDLAASQLGFLEWSGSGPIPTCTVKVKMPRMRIAERICIRFCARGLQCDYKTSCNFAHPIYFNQIPRVSQAPFKNFVKQTPGLDFAQGQGPPGTI